MQFMLHYRSERFVVLQKPVETIEETTKLTSCFVHRRLLRVKYVLRHPTTLNGASLEIFFTYLRDTTRKGSKLDRSISDIFGERNQVSQVSRDYK